MIKGVKYVLGLSKNLLSVGQITNCHNLVIFSKTKCLVITDSSPFTKVAIGTRDIHNGLYRLTSLHSNLEAHLFVPPEDVEAHPLFTPELQFDQLLETHVVQNLSISQLPVSVDNKPPKISKAQHEQICLWHARMGHISFANLSLLSRMCVGIPILPESTEVCHPCQLGKQTREKIPKVAENRATEILQLIHSDLCGPFPVQSLGKAKYFLTFTDDKSRKTWIYFLQTKSQTFEKFKYFKSQVEN